MWSPVEWVGRGGAGTAPAARGKHSATLLGGYVYVLGGRGAGGALPLRDFWRYCLASGVWEKVRARGAGPPALQEHSATAHGSKLYVFGGEPAPSAETPLWIYDTETQEWRKLPGQAGGGGGGAGGAGRRRGGGGRGALSPRGRRGHSAHALKDCLLVYGGYQDLRGSTSELWAFHYESESWQQVRTAGAGPARHRHAAAVLRGRLYVHGGQCDLRACSDLWHYDTMSRVWTLVRPRGPTPGARAGHAGLRAGGHLYVFGGERPGAPDNHLWRFHFASETWERIEQGVKWPSARVDACALLVPGAAGVPGVLGVPGARDTSPPRAPAAAEGARGAAPLLARLSSFQLRRTPRCSYSVLAPERDSTESLVRHEAALAKSRSAHAVAAAADAPRALPRDPTSVPDLADADLVGLDSDDDAAALALPGAGRVRFVRARRGAAEAEAEEAELSTSDYASAERVSRPASGFSNPHYLGGDVRALAALGAAPLTPDSGVGAHDIELRPLRARSPPPGPPAPPPRLHLLLLGGRETPQRAHLHSPISMWTYRLL